MSFVKRDDQGKITGISLTEQDGFNEPIDLTSSEFIDFVSKDLEAESLVKGALEDSDNQFVRATEDLIHLLVQKQIILFTELPAAVQNKLNEREFLRKSLQEDTPSIIDDAGSI